MALDGLDETEPGALERDQISLFPQFLAIGYGPCQAPDSATVSIGPAAQPSTLRYYAIRILLNLHGTICFVNLALLGMAWMAVQCDGMTTDSWIQGFSLIRRLTEWIHIPFNLQTCVDLLELLDSVIWGPKDLAR